MLASYVKSKGTDENAVYREDSSADAFQLPVDVGWWMMQILRGSATNVCPFLLTFDMRPDLSIFWELVQFALPPWQL